jgi:hypothetical protein
MEGRRKEKCFFENKPENVVARQNSIHSRNSKHRKHSKSEQKAADDTSLKIKVCIIDNTNFQTRNQSMCWSTSEPKMDLSKYTSYKSSPRRKPHMSLKKIKPEDCTSKVSGWEEINEFSERDQFF